MEELLENKGIQPVEPACGTKPIRVRIVIPTFNEAKHIENTIASLQMSGRGDIECHFVIADGNSTDGTGDIVRRMAAQSKNITLLINEKRYQSAGVNLGAFWEGGDYDYLIRCDAHAFYPEDFVLNLVQTARSSGADSVVVPMDSVGNACFQKAVALVSDSLIGSGGSKHRGGQYTGWIEHGHHALFVAERFRALGGYDERLTHVEDVEYDSRLSVNGGTIFMDGAIRIKYFPRRNVKSLFQQYRNYGRGRALVAIYNHKSFRVRQAAIAIHVGLLALCLVLAPFVWYSLLYPAAYIAALVVTSMWIALANRVPCGLLAGGAALAMHLGWGYGFWSTILKRGLFSKPRPKASPLNQPVTRKSGLSVLLVDPSRFTAPYDSCLSEGLRYVGVNTTWLSRALRPGEDDMLSEQPVVPLFYKKVDSLPKKWKIARDIAKALSHIVGLVKLINLARKRDVDIVHFQWAPFPLVDALAIFIIGHWKPVVITAHDTIPYNGSKVSFLQTLGYYLPMKLARRVIAHTRKAKEVLVRVGIPAERVEIIPHGPLFLQRPGEESIKSPIEDGTTRFTFFGQIKHYKGIDIFLSALGQTPEAWSGSRIVIAGQLFMSEDDIRAQILATGCADAIEFRPWRHSNEELHELLNATDCFIFPYRHVDASGAYFLAKSYRRWIIATRVGVFEEDLVDGETGTLVESEDVDSLNKALRRFVEEKMRPKASSSTKWEDIGLLTKGLYETCLGGPIGQSGRSSEGPMRGSPHGSEL